MFLARRARMFCAVVTLQTVFTNRIAIMLIRMLFVIFFQKTAAILAASLVLTGCDREAIKDALLDNDSNDSTSQSIEGGSASFGGGVPSGITMPSGVSEDRTIRSENPAVSSVSGTLRLDESHVYFIQSISSFNSLVLTTSDGDADLYVYDASGTQICSSIDLNLLVDRCNLTGEATPMTVEVRGFKASTYQMAPS